MSRLTMKERLHLVGPILLVMGLVSSKGLFDRFIHNGPSLDEVGVSTVSTDGEAGPFTGSWLFIEVGGEIYRCSGDGKWPSPRVGVEVLYDPSDPSNCRDKGLVGRLSSYEGLVMLGCANFLLFGGPVTLWAIVSYRRKREHKRRILHDLDR